MKSAIAHTLLLFAGLAGGACTGTIGTGISTNGTSGHGGSDDPGVTVGGPSTGSQPPSTAVLRRITAAQYRNTIADIFGADVVYPTLEQEPALLGYASVGASSVGTSPVGVERYQAAATAITSTVFATAARRSRLAACAPTKVDDADCATAVLSRLGRTLYRRPLSASESERLVALAIGIARDHKDFWKGIEWATLALLQSPKFLYRSEFGTASSGEIRRFEDFELAARLSFFVWNASPDEALLDAAQQGKLRTAQDIQGEIKRLLLSDKARRGFRSFFQEYVHLDDSTVAAAAASTVAIPASLYMAAREQTLLTLENAFFEQEDDISEVLRSPVTFMTRELAQHYGVPAPAGDGFSRVSLPQDGMRKGVLGHASLLIKFSNQPNSAPTARGKFVREAFLCQGVPPPPPNVDELPVPIMDRPITMRERLEEHRSNPACASCHALTDPVGLGLENFDSLGKYRDKENGLAIDPSGELDGDTFANPGEMADAIGRHPQLAGCFVRQLYRHATGEAEPDNAPILDDLARRYVGTGKSLVDLITTLVTTDAFLNTRSPL
jgi:Protein of unknown function (DUF1588)/Protein of unknown function (DUF1592)/Protein of unknown function (DUF1595)/Protein of unknown function (DUF1587)/Protein of unknown function (DUF1585)